MVETSGPWAIWHPMGKVCFCTTDLPLTWHDLSGRRVSEDETARAVVGALI
jgi:hypothetical protein